MRKTAAALATLGLTITSILAAASPAAAIASVTVCTTYDDGDVKTCLRANYAPQPDGSGVNLDGYGISTPNGCGQLENFNQYVDVRIRFIDPDTGNVRGSLTGDAHDCNYYKPYSVRGSDKGPMLVAYNARARVDFGSDVYVHLGVKVFPNGDSKKAYAYTTGV